MRTLTMIRALTLTLALALTLPTVLHAQQADEQLILKHFHSISSEEIAGWMTELCSPKYNGRLAGTPGIHCFSRVGGRHDCVNGA